VETKSFIKTSEFWFTAMASLMTIYGMLSGALEFATGMGILTGGSGLYSLARGLAKQGVPPIQS
jgi:hypothetical protein